MVLVPALMYGLGAAASGAETPTVTAPGTAGETQTCLECHSDQADGMAGGPHRVVTNGPDAELTRISCTSCHAGIKAHWEDDPEANPMSVPGQGTVAETAGLCSSCHTSPHQENAATLSQHAVAGVGCLDCHQVHAADYDKQLKMAQPELCWSCHTSQRADFAKPYRHAVGEGVVNCSDCHLATEDNLAPLARRGRNEACFTCHAEFQGPFPFEHQATVDWSTEEGGCVTCHDPHGSYLPRMLTQPYEAPHFQLCSQCHVVPKHNFNSQHGTDWAGVSCSECHSDIHGSYTSRLFLTPTLEAQGCFVAGCHSQ